MLDKIMNICDNNYNFSFEIKANLLIFLATFLNLVWEMASLTLGKYMLVVFSLMMNTLCVE